MEDEETNVKKLYITGIESQDHGRYLCSGMIGGVKQEKFVKLEVISEDLSCFCCVICDCCNVHASKILTSKSGLEQTKV